MTSPVKIHVAGDAYWAFFFIPPGRWPAADADAKVKRAHAHRLPVGAEYIYRAIKAACDPPGLLTSRRKNQTYRDVHVTRGPHLQDTNGIVPMALYEIEKVDVMLDHDDNKTELPLLRQARAETQEVSLAGVSVSESPLGGENSSIPKKPDVLVTWFGELLAKGINRPAPPALKHKVQIQVGLAATLAADTTPASIKSPSKPQVARIIVVNVGELSEGQRIRRNLSYEAIAVDLLRFLRGTNELADPRAPLQQLSMIGAKAAPQSVLVVRLNNSAVFLYACRWEASELKEDGAWLLCHHQESAPLSQPELGQMVGYTGFVSAQIAAAMASYLTTYGSNTAASAPELLKAVIAGARRALMWQHVNFERGCLHMLFKKQSRVNFKRGGSQHTWVPTSANVNDPMIGYDDMCAEIVLTINKKYQVTQADGKSIQDSKKWSQIFDGICKKNVLEIQVQIDRAVAHRTQWFMARSIVVPPSTSRIPSHNDEEVEEKFRGIAHSWLHKPETEYSIPIVKIGKAELTDRREVEDFLAIHQALSVYSHHQEARPLNIAVFGSPGSGKSYAVRQVVQHIGKTNRNKYKLDPLTFNLGQFKTLDDLPAALHLVRNECLSREIPIVFFDEFDSSFNGQSFGWLKYLLAPMQDGEFYHAGQNYKLGHAVFVFAGGVNRSFEELNGRMRNPGFCEAKGPDFISRLKAHLNVQGINKSEAEADQGRYVLRRGILLRSLVRRHLNLKEEETERELLHPSVAHALLTIDRFKHGVRSLEAIIKMCTTRSGHPIGPSDLPSIDQLEMHVDAMKLLGEVDRYPVV